MNVLQRARNYLRRKQADAGIEKDVRPRPGMLVDDALRVGTSEADEGRATRLRSGNAMAMRERSAGADAAQGLDWIWRDVKFALRQLRRSSAFTVAAILTLALGIGATTSIFTLVHQVMLRSLPVARPDQLWRIGDAVRCCYSAGYTQGDGSWLPPNDWSFFSLEAYKLFRDNTTGFGDLAAFQVGLGQAELAVRRAGSSAPIATHNGEYVSGNFFETFGISAWRGRLFTDADDREGMAPVAVMSFHTWQDKYGSDPSVVGASYQLNGHAFTVIGVGPPGFFGAKIADWGMPDFWLPLATEPLIAGAASRLKNPRLAWLDLIGRVRPGTNPRTLETQVQVELHQWLASHVADMSTQEKVLWEKQTVHLTPGGAGVSLMREKYKDGLRLLFVAAVCVLLVACGNIANLLLARGRRDRSETALRAALGASRARLVGKALAESLTLALFGAVAGIVVAYAGANLILHLAIAGPDAAMRSDAWIPVGAAPSPMVLLFALGISVITAVVFGIAPAWAASRAEPIEALRGANRSVGRNRHWAQKTLVVGQVAVSLVLLSTAAMLGQSLRNLEHQNYGFDMSGRYLVSIDPKISNYEQQQLVPLFREIQDHLHAIPGVRMVGSALYAPMSGSNWGHNIQVEGKPDDDYSANWTRVTPGFFETLGNTILVGRPISDADNADTRSVAVVNEAFAKRFLSKENPIGQHFGPAPRKNAGMYEIIGVASDMRYFGDAPEPMYFLPEEQTSHFDEADTQGREVWSHYLYNIVIWAPGNPPALETEVKSALANVDPNLVMNGVQRYSELIRADFAEQNMIASLTWLFGAVGLALAAVGLYGVTAYGVEQQISEIGVRMALGADRGSVVAMVLRGAFGQVALGLALGIPAAIAVGHLISSQLFGVRPWDPLMLSVATALLLMASLIAAVIPASRAASVDPMHALRAE
jgi:putative ABC transport system permease protein